MEQAANTCGKTLGGVIRTNYVNRRHIHSFRFVLQNTARHEYLIKVPSEMCIPPLALTSGDNVDIVLVRDRIDAANGYDASLWHLSNRTTGKNYRSHSERTRKCLRATVGTSEVP